MTFVTYSCDREACGKRVEGHSERPPKGWGRTVWVPGILQLWDVPENLRQRRVWHYCGRACFDADAPARQAHEDRVRAAYDRASDLMFARGA